MDLLISLWLAVLVSGVTLFFISFLTWAVLPFHKHDFTPLADDEPVRAAVRSLGLPPGHYMFPYAATEAQSRTPEYQAKYKAGPSGVLTVFRDANMKVNMLLTCLTFLVVSFLIAYLLSITLERGAGFWRVFQVGATAGILAFSFAQLPHQVWFQATTGAKLAAFIEGVIYGFASGAVFALMWPA
jgi:hypothetical protein